MPERTGIALLLLASHQTPHCRSIKIRAHTKQSFRSMAEEKAKHESQTLSPNDPRPSGGFDEAPSPNTIRSSITTTIISETIRESMATNRSTTDYRNPSVPIIREPTPNTFENAYSEPALQQLRPPIDASSKPPGPPGGGGPPGMGFPKVEYPTGFKLYSTIFALYLAGFLTALVRQYQNKPPYGIS